MPEKSTCDLHQHFHTTKTLMTIFIIRFGNPVRLCYAYSIRIQYTVSRIANCLCASSTFTDFLSPAKNETKRFQKEQIFFLYGFAVLVFAMFIFKYQAKYLTILPSIHFFSVFVELSHDRQRYSVMTCRYRIFAIHFVLCDAMF